MSKKWTLADVPDQSGRTYLITGAAGGIGLVATRELARAGAGVVMAVRDPAKGERAARSLGPVRGQIEVRELDVSSLASIREFTRAWSGPLDVLINNAGIMMVPEAHTGDGLESQMATNYFGPFALTNTLLPHIGDRVVSISSQLHRMGRMRAEDLNGLNRRYNPWFAYCDSKLDLLLFSHELQRRLEAAHSPVRSVIAHPGIAKTGLVSHVGGVSGWLNGLARPLLNEADNGGLPTLYAATQDVAPNAYVGPDGFGSIRGFPKVRKPSRAARKDKSAAALWDATIDIIGPEFDFRP
ncbi:SDR family NAD(P)-dependent oxidoreductase [Streptomyces zingiberis]|uniref:SDR family NAD(P)-dependent oxidoreductase n=1 Tax=Streptomyces zingiberis TaxID=2053010 RepID=A0ABX1BR68_9ACTN|nr:SDR family NAD(P)-dependent oxidoreductase [Streptomyces zingiberis]NJQ00212.1 SDR family NAD(P)-dependent oxidoreductase [Streptomyces zingiberis]